MIRVTVDTNRVRRAAEPATDAESRGTLEVAEHPQQSGLRPFSRTSVELAKPRSGVGDVIAHSRGIIIEGAAVGAIPGGCLGVERS